MATNEHPVEDALLDRTIFRDRDQLYTAWAKARDRLSKDPDGAVTAARSFLESICKQILDATSLDYSGHADLMKLFRQVSAELRLSTQTDAGRIEQQFNAGTYQIIQSLTELRNVAGDAHGKGSQGPRASHAQAELAVNLSGSMGAFLLRRLDSHLAATRRVTSGGNAILRFDKTTVWRLLDHARNAPEHLSPYFQKRRSAALWLVADAGIYLMSNGSPGIGMNGRMLKNDTKRAQRLVAHADGCGPADEIEDWRPIQETMSGGSDFCEPLSIRQVEAALENCDRQIVLVFGSTHYKILGDREFEEGGSAAELD